MEYADFVEKCVKEYKETENEFVYQLIYPFCETVVEKKLSKAELEQILKKGMQKSISLEKVKKAREDIHNAHLKMLVKHGSGNLLIALEILDNLIESEEK